MRIPVISGMIRRRLLVNFRVAPDVVERLVPSPLKPKLQNGFAIAGLCLIRLEKVRPRGLPELWGVASENAAHRIAVTWADASGRSCEGVYVARRDTGSRLNWLAGGRIFPGIHHFGRFDIRDNGKRIHLEYRSLDGVEIQIAGVESNSWPRASCFGSIDESSRFFEAGSLGFSTTNDCCRLDGLELRASHWSVTPFEVETVRSTWICDESVFPAGSAVFDHALVMREIPHEWHSAGEMRVKASRPDDPLAKLR